MRQETLAQDSINSSLTNHGLHVVNDTLIATAPDGFDDSVFLQFKKALLDRVHRDGMRQVVIDVSPVLFLDSGTFELLSSTARMLSLLGARVVFSGFQPGVVAALIELGDVATNSNLRDALADAFCQQNFEVRKVK